MKYSKEEIEKIFNVTVIAVVGTTKFLTVKKEELLITKNGHRVIDTTIFYGSVDIINDNPVYNCKNSECYWYDIDNDKITKLC